MKIFTIIFPAIFFINLSNAQAPPIEWQKCYGGPQTESSYCIQQTSDSGYVVCGFTDSYSGQVTSSYGGWDVSVIKMDAAGNLVWQKSYGGTSEDVAFSIQQTTDGGYIVAGWTLSTNGLVTGSHGNYDYWVLRLDNSGNLIWQKTFGGSGIDRANSVVQTTDGGFIVAGVSESSDGDITATHGNGDYWVIKLDANGNITWQKCYGGSDGDDAREIKQTPDGGYIVVGSTSSNDGDVNNPPNVLGGAWILKLNGAGVIQWEKTYGSFSGTQLANSVCLTNDGGYAIAITNYYGHDKDITVNYGSSDYWIIKLDAAGTLVWQKSYGGPYHDEPYHITQTADGGFAVLGWSDSYSGDATGNHGGSDYWITRISAIGTLLWQKTMGGSYTDQSYSMRQTTDHGFIISGYSGSNNDGDVTGNHGTNTNDIWVVKLAPVVKHSTTNITVCPSALPYTWNGNTYNITGTDSLVLTTSDGWDSIPILNLTVLPAPAVELGNDTTLCFGNTLVLDAGFPNASYLWQDGSTAPGFTISKEGIYWVRLEVDHCSNADTLVVDFKECDCVPSIPNAFTPNGDGINEQWVISHHCSAAVIVSVYNRYGSLVYHSDQYRDDWKGTYGSKNCPDGTYYYVLKLVYPGQKEQVFRGNLTILR